MAVIPFSCLYNRLDLKRRIRSAKEGDGCTASLRLWVFRGALQDFRALCLLEQPVGREQTMAFVARQLPGLIFRHYPHSADTLLPFREAVNEKMRRHLASH